MTTFGEGPTAVVEGPFADTKRAAFTGQDIRFTRKGDTVYAIALAWPASGTVSIKALAANAPAATREIAAVEALGVPGGVKWTRDGEALHLQVGAPPTPAPAAVAFRISFR